MSKLFFRGVPADVDVRAIEAAWPEITAGMVITHDDIARVAGLDVKSTRYRSVTAAWRRKLQRENSIVFAAVTGIGFRALTDAEKVDTAVDKFTSGARMQRRAIGISGHADRSRLTTESSAKLDHFIRLSAVALEAAAATVRGVSLAAVQPQAPRILAGAE